MDSSPDLSLKLRRGSNDSRESNYYMDFAQGIDSDIEEVTTIASPSMVVSPATASTSIAPPPPPTANIAADEHGDDETVACAPQSASIDASSDSELTASGNVSTIVAAPSPHATSTITNSSENNDSTDTDDDISPSTPLPMPLLPPIPLQQMMPKIPLVDEG